MFHERHCIHALGDMMEQILTLFLAACGVHFLFLGLIWRSDDMTNVCLKILHLILCAVACLLLAHNLGLVITVTVP